MNRGERKVGRGEREKKKEEEVERGQNQRNRKRVRNRRETEGERDEHRESKSKRGRVKKGERGEKEGSDGRTEGGGESNRSLSVQHSLPQG